MSQNYYICISFFAIRNLWLIVLFAVLLTNGGGTTCISENGVETINDNLKKWTLAQIMQVI